VRASRIAWCIAGVSAILAVVDTVLVAVSYELISTEAIGIHGWPLVNIAALGSAVIGAVILGSQPRQPIGWLLNLIGLSTSISLTAESYGAWILQYDGPGTAANGHLGAWIAALLGGPLALACLTVVFLLVPAGSFLSPRWRWVARAAAAGYAGFATGLVMIGPSRINRNAEPVDTGLVADILLGGGTILIILMLIASVVSLLIRLRRSSGPTRQQVRVVAIGAGSVGLALVFLIVGESTHDGRQSWWSSVPLYASYAFLVACLAVAVLRYRLYDVEVIVSRALMLAIATGLVAAGYVGLVVVFSGMVGDRADGGIWLSLLATVLVALAFQPARRSVVRLADRLAYGNRAVPYEALADFSRRIGRSPATSHLLPTIAAAAGEAVQADLVIVRVDGEGGAQLTATWPRGLPAPSVTFDPTEGDVLVPVRDESGDLGSISLRLPPGRDVRPVEHRLLSDIAEQAGLALRNDRLQLELAARVRQLDERTHLLAASRNRIIGVADTERQRLEAEIGRRVMPAMERLRAEVGEAATGAADAQKIGACSALATEALESLRELTRGIYPTMLVPSGLGPALTSYAARMQRVESLHIGPSIGASRFPARVEAAAYFCCVEVLDQPTGEVGLDLNASGQLVLSMRGLSLDALNRLAILDRVEACEGSIDAPGGPDDGASLRVRLPASSRQTTAVAADRG
jgi:signal transduction histidine kinase